MDDAKKFKKIVQLRSFSPFTTAEEALEEINAVARSECTDSLANFLEQTLPKAKKGINCGYHFYSFFELTISIATFNVLCDV